MKKILIVLFIFVIALVAFTTSEHVCTVVTHGLDRDYVEVAECGWEKGVKNYVPEPGMIMPWDKVQG